jgi:phosphate transport system substrate-binding protein
MTLRAHLLAALLAAAPLIHAAPVPIDPALPHYEPRPFTVPKDAPYLRPDGSIFLAGASAMRVALGNLNALFVRSHPETRFTTLLSGSSVGAPALLFGLTPFAVVDRILLPEEVVPFQMRFNRDPLAIRVGRGSYSKLDLTPAIVVCVNPANPLDRLTTEEVARIFTSGGGTGDLTTWGQVGLSGIWSRRPIQPIGMARRTGEAVFMKTVKFGDFPLSDRYEGMKSGDIAQRLQGDVTAIALVDLAHFPAGAKVVAIGPSEAGPFSRASYEDVLAGRYPYSSYIYFYLNHAPGAPLDPFAKEYLRMVLSQEGQRALTDQPNGFLPLTAAEASAELAKLGSL